MPPFKDYSRPIRGEDLTRKNVEAIALMEEASQKQRTLGDRVADKFASAVGSWTFIITQSIILAFWVTVNVIGFIRRWDPYPFILLNLMLSFQAAYTGPIVMMSQNRQSRVAERRNHLDLQINLLAEQENTEMLRLLRKLCQHHQVPIGDEEPSLEALEEATEPDKVIRQIEEKVEGKPKSEVEGQGDQKQAQA